MIEKLGLYFQYSFVRYALIAGVLIALCSSLLGVTLVLKRFSFIGDGLSHVAFGAIAIASIVHLTDEMLLVLPVTVISAVFLLRTGKNAKEAAFVLQSLSCDDKNRGLLAVADALEAEADAIIKENAKDIENAKARGNFH